MNGVKIITEGEGCWPDLIEHFANNNVVQLSNGHLMEIAMLKDGTTCGKPSLTIRLNLPDGRIVLAETTLDLFVAAARAFEAASLYQNEN